MPVANVWGPIVAAPAMRKAITATLQLWLPSTLAETARQAGLTAPQVAALPLVKTWKWIAVNDAARLPVDQLPAVFVTSPGLADGPARNGKGSYTYEWNATVTAVARGQSYEDTADLVGFYVAAIRTACVQQPSFGGFSTACVLAGEDYALFDASVARTIAAGFVDLVVTVKDVANAYAGPATPPVDPLAAPAVPAVVLTHDMAVRRTPQQ